MPTPDAVRGGLCRAPAHPAAPAWCPCRPPRAVKAATAGPPSGRLFVSEHTVQRHVQNAFEKVGVRSRGELVSRLFFENLLSDLFGD